MTGNQPYFLRNIWYYALPSDRLQPGKMVAKTLLGEPILFGRDRQGKAFAMRDICPHRGIPLSYGKFDGCEVECCYHGWRFDPQGHCTAIPALTDDQASDLDLQRLRIKPYPVQEAQGNLWIYMPEDPRAIDPVPVMDIPLVPDFGDRPYQSVDVFHFPCYVDHAVIGLMDPAHGPFVHQVWWWRPKTALFEKAKAFGPKPYGFAMLRHKLLRQSLIYRLLGGTPEVEITFRLPGVRIEHIKTAKHTVCNLTAVTPISETETEVTTLFYWTVPWINLLRPILKPLVTVFMNQDRDVVIKQQDGLKYDPSLMLIKDADAQARWYYQLKAEYAKATAEQREFINPVKEQVLRWRS